MIWERGARLGKVTAGAEKGDPSITDVQVSREHLTRASDHR
jgi:hypothetical protein